MVRLPRRHAQRQAIRRLQQKDPTKSHLLKRVRFKRKLRAENDCLDSSDDLDFKADSDSYSDKDSGYSSEKDVRSYFTEKIAQHKENGPIMANHSVKTKEMIETGRAYFYEYVS